MNGMETLVVGRSLGRTLMWFLAAFLLAPLGAGYALAGFGFHLFARALIPKPPSYKGSPQGDPFSERNVNKPS